MAATQHPWKALAIPFADQIEVFLSEFPEQISLRDAPVAHQLDALSRLLKTSQYTLRVAILFSPLLVDLCARWLDDEEQDELKFTAFALLVPAHEELYPSVPSSNQTHLKLILLQSAFPISLEAIPGQGSPRIHHSPKRLPGPLKNTTRPSSCLSQTSRGLPSSLRRVPLAHHPLAKPLRTSAPRRWRSSASDPLLCLSCWDERARENRMGRKARRDC